MTNFIHLVSTMPDSLYNLLQKMNAENIILAYKGEINSEMLESVYEMFERHGAEKKIPNDRHKKFFHILTESLQNIFHHQSPPPEGVNEPVTGFIITNEESVYKIVTGNYIVNNNVAKLKARLEQVNSLSPDELRTHYQKVLSESGFSEKGGAGLGIIEMARKSGSRLDYEFRRINEEYSFFTLAITIP